MGKVLGIIGAMEAEISAIKAMVQNPEVKTISGIDYVSGTINEKEVVVAKCGIGKVFAAICTEAMIVTYQPEMIVNIGVGGSLSPNLKVGDVAIAQSVVQHDMDTTPIGDPLGLISGINVIYFDSDKKFVEVSEECAREINKNYELGVIASGDCFVNDSARKKLLVDEFKSICCEMEGGAIGHVCFVNKTRFGIIRTISDGGDENSGNDYMQNLAVACDSLMKYVKLFLSKEML